MHSTSDASENNIFTYNEAIIRFTMEETNTRVNQYTQTDVLLHFSTPEFVKTAFPASGSDNEHPATVVKNSVLEYTLNVTNPDSEVHLENVELEDTLDATKVKVDEANIRVKVGNSEATNIGKSVHIKSYSLTYNENEKKYIFKAVIASIPPLTIKYYINNKELISAGKEVIKDLLDYFERHEPGDISFNVIASKKHLYMRLW